MLEELLEHLNNWFAVGIYKGQYKIEDGAASLPFLRYGQYYRIIGSIFNDGLHRYGDHDLADEEFCGSVWALAVPTAVQKLSFDIEQWAEDNKNANGAFQSESFGGYSYTKATDSNGDALTWQGVFRKRLNRWRKI